MIIIRFIKHLINNYRYTKILEKVYKDENFIENLSKIFNVSFKKDWIGRIYAVFNPHVQNGIYDPNVYIYEYDSDDKLSNEIYIESYIMNTLNTIKHFIRANNLFDMLTYKLKRLDDYDNYLFIIQPITLDDYLKSLKRLVIFLIIMLIIAIILIFLYKFI